MNDEELKKENKVQDIVAITENFKSKEINDDENSLLEENNIGHIPIKILKRKLCVSLIGVFLGACYYTWSLTGHWNISNGLQNNKIYIGIGLTIAIMIVIFCVAMLILEKQQKKRDKQTKKHNILMLGLFLAMIGCVALSLTITNKSILGYHLSFEAPAFFILAKLAFLIGYISLAKSKPSKTIGSVAFIMKIVGSFALLNEAIEGTKLYLNINNIGINIMLGIAIFGVLLMTGNILSNAKDTQIISLSPCFSFSCCRPGSILAASD